MSEYILCKGKKDKLDILNSILITETDVFMKKVASTIWLDDDVWSIKVDGKEIDYYLTKAQKDIINGLDFLETELYKIISELIDCNISFAMWYDIYYEDLPIYTDKMTVKDACYNGIIDISGMCEVYLIYNALSNL